MNLDLHNITNEQIFTISESLNIKRISPAMLKKVAGYVDASDEEIDSIIDSLYKLSLLTLVIAQI